MSSLKKTVVRSVAAISTATALCACSGVNAPVDSESITHLPDFAALNFAPESSDLRQDSIDLYVDYSTCVAEAMQSPFYQSVHPAIVDAAPTFYSIKGDKITRETDNKQEVYALLKTIKEVNNADLKSAVADIVSGDRQAILLTDAEYFMKGVTGDNLNNPYLADEFRKWMQRGNDIYIYSEPYVESGKFNKFRYYMIFTDDRIADNLHDRFVKSVHDTDAVSMFHLSSKAPRYIKVDKKYPVIDENLSFNESNYMTVAKNGIEMQEWLTNWPSIRKYMLEEAVNAAGMPVKDGLPLVRGLFVENDPSEAYKIKEIDVRVSQLTPAFMQYMDSINAGAKPIPAEAFEEVDDLFTINEDVFEKTGEIMLYLDTDMDGTTLLTDGRPNLLKVDFIIDEAEENFTDNDDINKNFKWQSIQAANAGKYNTSLYESIRQALIDKKNNPAKGKDPVVYTIYLNTCNL